MSQQEAPLTATAIAETTFQPSITKEQAEAIFAKMGENIESFRCAMAAAVPLQTMDDKVVEKFSEENLNECTEIIEAFTANIEIARGAIEFMNSGAVRIITAIARHLPEEVESALNNSKTKGVS